MKIPLSWLTELVQYDLTPTKLADRLSVRSIGVKQATDHFLELDLTYNRGDLLSLRCVAYEIAAITNSKVKFKESQVDFPKVAQVKVEIADETLCPVYCLAKIENLKVEQSPKVWKQKLLNAGIRSINNVADITNLVMVEYGQPLHAFDEGKVRGGVRVRVAKPEEKITTLDGKIRNLNQDDLLITDENGPIGIAGVMGGKDSEITNTSKTILLEAAIFDPVNIRKTATRLGLQSEASKRFQHGLTKKRLLQALDAAIKMYEGLGGKLTAITLVGNLKDEEKIIKLTQDKLNSLIGVEIPPAEVESSLKKLGFVLASPSQTWRAWEVTVPYWRLDISIEEDLIEEVARMYGYEKIPAKQLTDNIPKVGEEPIFGLIENLKQTLFQAGLTEVQTYSFYSSKVIGNCQLSTENLIHIANPISSETEYLRDNLWPNLVEVAAKNIKQGYKQSLPSGEGRDIGIFEIGKVYLPKASTLPDEPYRLAIALVNGTDNPIQELYQISQSVHLGGGIAMTPRELFHPTRLSDGLAEIHPRIVNKFGVEQRVAVLEIEIKGLL